MYKCNICGKEFLTRHSHNGHKVVHGKKRKTINCNKCGADIIVNNYKKHINSCDGLGVRISRKKNGNYLKGKTYEEAFGKEKAKEIKTKIAKGASDNYNYESQEKYWTKEKRKEKSEEKKKFFLENPEKHPNRILANNRNNLSYPEKLVINYFEENNINFEIQYRIKTYYVDFLLDNNVVIEVDGSYWHDKNDIKEINRQKEIEKEGYKVYRIDAKNVLKNLENLHIL